MNVKAILSSKGQLIIPKLIRNKLGLHCGSELIIELKNHGSLEIYPIKKDIDKFFGKGKKKRKVMSIEEIDDAIGEAVIKNDRN